jgi:hypothetical protein
MIAQLAAEFGASPASRFSHVTTSLVSIIISFRAAATRAPSTCGRAQRPHTTTKNLRKPGALEMVRLPTLDTATQDLRFACRALRKAPGFSVTVVLTLALGVGAITTVFSILDAVFLRQLHYRNSERLYVVREVLPQLKTPLAGVNALHFREWRSAARSFDDMALLFGFDTSLTRGTDPEQIYAAQVSPSLFSMLGVTANAGRLFFDEEDQPGFDRVVVLTHDLWMRRFAGNAAAVGQTIALDGELHTIIGVLPRGFAQLYPRTFCTFKVEFSRSVDWAVRLATFSTT